MRPNTRLPNNAGHKTIMYTVKAICAREFRESVKRAAGVMPAVSPPLTIETFRPDMISPCNLLYIKLHGLPGQKFLYGTNLITAVSAEQIRQCNLKETIVFAATCFFPESGLMPAFFDAGVTAIIAGRGENYADRTVVAGADLLGIYVRKLTRIRATPETALKIAIRVLDNKLALRKSGKAADALSFEVFRRDERTNIK